MQRLSFGILEGTFCHRESSQEIQGSRVRELGYCSSSNSPLLTNSASARTSCQKPISPCRWAAEIFFFFSASWFQSLPLLRRSLVWTEFMSSIENLLMSIPRRQQPGKLKSLLQIYLEWVICPGRRLSGELWGPKGHTMV